MSEILHIILSPFAYVVVIALREFKEKAFNEFCTLFYFTPPVSYQAVLYKFGWWVLPEKRTEFNLPKLRLFHYLLVQYGFIACSYEEFEIHFIHSKLPLRKIVWSGDVTVFVLLFDNLIFDIDKKIIPPPNNLYDVLCEHFEILDKKKNVIKSLNRKSLPVILNQAKSNGSVADIVKNICDLLLS